MKKDAKLHLPGRCDYYPGLLFLKILLLVASLYLECLLIVGIMMKVVQESSR